MRSSVSLKPTPRHWLLFICLTLFWGTSFLQIALSLRSFTPEQIVVWRLCLAAGVLLMYLVYTKKKLPRKILDWLKFVMFAVLGNILPYWLISTGQQTVSSGLAGLLMAIMPLMTILLAHWFIPNERLNRYRIIGFGMGISGVIFVLWPSLISATNSFFGALIILLAACCYAINTILVRRYANYDIAVISAGVMLSSALISLLVWPEIWCINRQQVSAVSAISLIWLGIVPTGVASIVFFILVKQAGPTFVSNNNYIIPVVAYLSGALFLGEKVSVYDLLALAVILVGILISRLDSAKNYHRG